MIGGKVKARLCVFRGGRDSICDAEVHKVVKFLKIEGSVGAFAGGEVM
jgi:hypothetical protein